MVMNFLCSFIFKSKAFESIECSLCVSGKIVIVEGPVILLGDPPNVNFCLFSCECNFLNRESSHLLPWEYNSGYQYSGAKWDKASQG